MIIEITWLDAQSLELSQPLVYKDDVQNLTGVKCSIVGYLLADNKDGYVLAKEKWETGQYKYIHFIPKKSVLTKRIIKR